MTKIIAIFNQAGGVMKTSLTMNLGYHLAQKHKVLLVDTDPQASLTTFMGLEPHELEEIVADSLLTPETKLPIHHNLHGMDLAPANITLSAVELQLSAVMARELRLKQALEPILNNYDFILIDCPPSLGILSILGLCAATHVLVPVQTHYKAFKGTELLLDSIKQVKKHSDRRICANLVRKRQPRQSNSGGFGTAVITTSQSLSEDTPGHSLCGCSNE